MRRLPGRFSLTETQVVNALHAILIALAAMVVVVGFASADEFSNPRCPAPPTSATAESAPIKQAAPAKANAEKPTADELLSKLPESWRTADAEAMVRGIAAGEIGPNQGWYRPGESRFGWEWLRARYDADGDEAVSGAELGGPETTFSRLDRDGSGRIQQDDFDWTDASPFMQKLGQSTQLFHRLDASSDGRLDRQEWLAAFDRLSANGDVLPEDLHALLFPPTRPWEPPSIEVLFAGVVSGEIGSHKPGPNIGDPAPDFELRAQNANESVRLSQFRGNKPVVLIFGSFT